MYICTHKQATKVIELLPMSLSPALTSPSAWSDILMSSMWSCTSDTNSCCLSLSSVNTIPRLLLSVVASPANE